MSAVIDGIDLNMINDNQKSASSPASAFPITLRNLQITLSTNTYVRTK